MKYLTPRTLLEASFIVLIGTIIGISVNLLHPKGVKFAFTRPAIEYADDSVFAQDLPDVQIGHVEEALEESAESGEPPVVSTAQIKQLLEHHQAIIVDARSEKEYAEGHIPTAINLPYEYLQEYFEKLQSLPQDKWLITHCDGPPCDLGELLAFELMGMGFPKVAIYTDGLNDWKKTEKIETGQESQNEEN